jgi:SAM-dependent MidA family methyltransferase
MEEEGRDREEGLRRFILSKITEGGPVSFSQFMEWCLFHPVLGYYSSGGARIGKEGDFYTASSVHPLFGQMIAKQLLQMAEILRGETFDVVEMGGGRGFLCKDILDWAVKKAPPFYRSLRYYLVETSPHFLAEQKRRLFEHGEEGKVFWIDSGLPGGERRFEGCFLSNELIDAFPVHRVIFDQDRLKEVFVTQRDGQFVEQLGELSDSRISHYFQWMGISLQEGQKAEVSLGALEWMEEVSRSLKRGFVLTIDYGFTADELYSFHRREGTLLCYFRHRISENPYEKLGKQDMTSHVNFTSLIQKGEEVGLRFTGLVPQYRFLIGLGLLQEIESLGNEMSELEAMKLRLSMKHLIEPEAGMGETFKVLIQHKGIERPELDGLRGLRSIPAPGGR